MSEDSASRRTWPAEALLVAAVLGALVAYQTPTLGRPLLDGHHVFRQTQTAYTARIFHEEGIDLAHPKVPVLGEPFEIPFELPLFQAGAAVLMDMGVGETVFLRLSGLACFLATALLLYGLVRRVAGRVTAFASLVAYAFTPFALLWSRTSMIEYLATAGAVGFTWSLISWRETRRPVSAALALVAGLVGMLVKPTTAVFWILPALAYRPTALPQPREHPRRDRVWTAALVVVPILAAAAWTRHADAIKAASRTTEWLTSTELREWNFGTLDQRLERGTWETILDRIRGTVALFGWIFLPVAVFAGTRSRQRWFWLGIASAVVLPPLVFTNLYYVHDYYLAAITPALAALIGLGAGYLWTLLPRRPVVLAAAVVFAVCVVVGSLGRGREYWYRADAKVDDPQLLTMARELQQLTKTDDLVAVVGLDWSPALLFYAHRRGHMVVPANESFAYDLIHNDGYRYLFASSPGDTDLTKLSQWRWLGSLGPHTYALADTRSSSPAHLLS